jgi:hypothetical protein
MFAYLLSLPLLVNPLPAEVTNRTYDLSKVKFNPVAFTTKVQLVKSLPVFVDPKNYEVLEGMKIEKLVLAPAPAHFVNPVFGVKDIPLTTDMKVGG